MRINMRRPLFYIIMFAIMTTAKGQTMQGNMKANGKVAAV